MIAFIYSEAYQKHLNGSYHTGLFHPESPDRVVAIEQQLRHSGLWDELAHVAPVEATTDQRAAVHDRDYVLALERVCERGPARLDPDTGVVPESYRVALLAAGGACLAVDKVISG